MRIQLVEDGEKSKTAMIQVAIPIFKGFTALDAVAPYEVLHLLPNVNVVFVSHKPGAYHADLGMLSLNATASFDDVQKPHVVVVPGGPGTQLLLQDQVFISWIRKVHENTMYTTSVCTGSLLLAASGILNGLEATTHWNCYNLLASYGVKPVQLRVVQQGKIITSGGVSSGLDMALRLAAFLTDENTAKALQLFIEYDPQPPYDTGAAAKAGPQTTELAKELAAKAAARMSGQSGDSGESMHEMVQNSAQTTNAQNNWIVEQPLNVIEAPSNGSARKTPVLRPRAAAEAAQDKTPAKQDKPPAKRKKVEKKRPDTHPDDEHERGKFSRWPEPWVIALIHIRGGMHEEFNRPPKQGVNLWQKVYQQMLTAVPEFDKDEEACRKKWKAVCTDYKDDKDMMASGNAVEKSKWFELIDEYMQKFSSRENGPCSSQRNVIPAPTDDKDDKGEEREEKKVETERVTRLQKLQLEEVHNFMERMANTNDVFVEQMKATTSILSNMQSTLAMLANKL